MAITDMLSVAEFYAQPWGAPYGGSHRGLDILRAAGRPVPHLYPGTIVWRGRGSEIGGGVVVDRGAGYAGKGRFIGYAHTVGGSGNALGHVADYDEDHGTKWSAPHTHVSVSDWADALYNANRPTYDPAPFVAAAITSPAGTGGTTPINETQEDDVSYGINITVISKPDPLNGKVAIGNSFVGAGTDPLVWVGNAGAETENGVVFVPWSTAQLAERIANVGIRGRGPDLGKVFAELPVTGVRPVYLLGGSPGSLEATPELVAAIGASVAEQLPELIIAGTARPSQKATS